MSVPARAERAPNVSGDPRHTPWSMEDAERALAARPDILERLRGGDPTALAEYLELAPGVKLAGPIKPV